MNLFVHLSRRFRRAVHYTMIVHGHDERASGTTTFAHLMGVSAIVIDGGGSEEEAIAALLHDAAEDHGGEARLSDVAVRFGDPVADIVRGCSDSLCAEKRLRPEWLCRKRDYVKRLPMESQSVWRVSVADKLDNARGVRREVVRHGPAFWARIGRTPEELVAYWATVQRTVERLHPSSDTSELGLLVAELIASYCNPAGYRSALDRLRPD